MPNKMIRLPSTLPESVYGPEDYATPGAVEVLLHEGQIGAALELQRTYGLEDTHAMDPMEFWIRAEECSDE